MYFTPRIEEIEICGFDNFMINNSTILDDATGVIVVFLKVVKNIKGKLESVVTISHRIVFII